MCLNVIAKPRYSGDPDAVGSVAPWDGKNATFSTIKLIRSGLEVNLCLHGERPIKQLLVFSVSESIYILVANDKN